MKSAALAIVLASGIIAVVACDGGGGSTGTTSGGVSNEPAGSPGQEDDYCKAQASHETCNGGSEPQPCCEDAKCIYGRLMSRMAANAYFKCYSAPECKSDDSCAAEAGLAVNGSTTYFGDCMDKVEACPGAKDDYCSPAIFAYPDVSGAAQACLSKPCGELEACFAAAVKPISDCK